MTVRVAINGFGRIGRLVLRVLEEREGCEVVAINDLADAPSLAHLLKFDSVHGRFPGTVESSEGSLVVNGREIRATAERDPAALPWREMDVDFCVESTGVFRSHAQCLKHVEAGAKKVVLTVPAKDKVDAMVVMGVNEDVLKPEHRVISNASCTTNCLAPVAKVLHDSFGIERGLMTTVHAYTNDQGLVDTIHSDLRRARGGAMNIIPTTTGAARAVGAVIPELDGVLDGFAMRVPVPNGSVVDLTVKLGKNASVDEINAALREASEGRMKGILGYTEEPIVSSDVIGDSRSSIVDGLSTMLIDNDFAKLVSWYDNEWGYCHRVVDLLLKAHTMSS